MIYTTAETTEAAAATEQLAYASNAMARLQRNFRPEAEKAVARITLTAARTRYLAARRTYYAATGKSL
jgi:hypothetical protein